MSNIFAIEPYSDEEIGTWIIDPTSFLNLLPENWLIKSKRVTSNAGTGFSLL